MTAEQREIAWEYVLLTLEFYPRYVDRVALYYDALRDLGPTRNFEHINRVIKAGR